MTAPGDARRGARAARGWPVVVVAIAVALLTACTAPPPPPPAAPPAPPAPPAASCSPGDGHCLGSRYVELAHREGVPASFAALDRQPEIDPGVCHHVVHEIGRAEADRHRGVAAAFARGDARCGGGYFHGVVETAVTRHDPAHVADAVDGFCGEVRAADPFGRDHLHCAHGLGHGFVSVSGRDLGRALDLCDLLSTERERQACYSGVFMQRMEVSFDDRSPAGFAPDRPLSPCTELADRYLDQCLQRQTTFLLEATHGSFPAAFARCGTLPERGRTPCRQGLGRDAVQQDRTAIGSPAGHDRVAALCTAGPDDPSRAACTVGAVKAFIRFRSGTGEARAFCDRVPGPVRATCVRAVEVHRTSADS